MILRQKQQESLWLKTTNMPVRRHIGFLMKVRIAKFISDSGIASRREAEKLIAAGEVFVGGARVDTPVFFVDGTEEVRVGADVVRPNESGLSPDASRIFAFHKPVNTIVSRSDPRGRKTIYDVLGENGGVPARCALKYVGRLDYKTTGLLLLTNDGELARRLMLPGNGMKRVYIAHLHPKKFAEIKNSGAAKALRGFLSPLSADDSIFDVLRKGAAIGGTRYAPMEVELLSRYPLAVKISLDEGKKNEIRIAMDYLGFMVKKLHRISYGSIELGDLKPGVIKELPDNFSLE
jgi:23S rRNA pseudouridine2605 synthase